MSDKDRKIERSEIFWFIVLTVALVITGFINIEVLGGVLALGSLFSIAYAMDGKLDDGCSPTLWILLMPITWMIIIFGGIILGLMWLYKHTIARFNEWLNRDKSEKNNTNEHTEQNIPGSVEDSW